MVQRAVLKREADRMGLQVSDEDLRRELQTGPLSQYLFPGGKFIGDDQYMNFVADRLRNQRRAASSRRSRRTSSCSVCRR